MKIQIQLEASLGDHVLVTNHKTLTKPTKGVISAIHIHSNRAGEWLVYYKVVLEDAKPIERRGNKRAYYYKNSLIRVYKKDFTLLDNTNVLRTVTFETILKPETFTQ
jgi:hypothetical protein